MTKTRPYGNRLTGIVQKTRVRPELEESLDRLAAAKQTSVSDLIRLALAEYLNLQTEADRSHSGGSAL